MSLGEFSELEKFINKTSLEPKGFFADTSILFAATYPSDLYNEDAEDVFKILKSKLSAYTNVNVKYEFLESHRRVLLADSLCDFYDIYSDRLPAMVNEKLKSHKTTHKKKVDADRPSKLEVEQQKNFIKLLRPTLLGERDAWDVLCKDFLLPQLEPVWDDACKKLGIVEIKVRETDESPLLKAKPDWADVVQIMGRYGIASADAMIVNMFNCSKINLLITADLEMARSVIRENCADKCVFVPESIFEQLKPKTTEPVKKLK
jgi:hypothetical protein